MSAVLNISSYKFVTLNELPSLRERLRAEARSRELKGTILLAEEGINLFLAGPKDAVRGWVEWLKGDARFFDLEPKESWSDAPPFKKLLIKIKNEIIRMNYPTIRPDVVGSEGRAPAVDAQTLKRWLDQGHDDNGRPVITLDTRNAFEVDLGTFEGAIDYRIEKFSEFPAQVQAQREVLRGKTIVSFCTGGIRCEKAALYMEEVGLEHVYQLEGGILKYLELTGGEHYRGSCFVFDERRTLAADLSPSPA